MRAGLLRERVTFQTFTKVINPAGIVSQTWADSFTVWGRIKQEDARSDEAMSGDKPTPRVRVTLIIRYDARVVSGLRVKWGSRLFEIEGSPLNKDERRRGMDLMLVERKSS